MRIYRLDKDEAGMRANIIIGEFERNCQVIQNFNIQKTKKYIIKEFLEVITDSRNPKNTEEALGGEKGWRR